MNRKLRVKIIEEYESQANFAAKVGVDDSVVSRVVRGRRALRPEEVVRWSKALRCDAEIVQESAR